MADSKESKVDAPVESKHPKGKLAPAGESGDPVVQQAMAELHGARVNRSNLEPNHDAIKTADEAVKVAEKRLNDLGFEA